MMALKQGVERGADAPCSHKWLLKHANLQEKKKIKKKITAFEYENASFLNTSPFLFLVYGIHLLWGLKY